MAQNGPHSHQVDAAASDDGHSAPPTSVSFSLESPGPHGNNGGSSAASGIGKKNLIPDLNMEERDDSADASKDTPRSEAKVEVAAADADADAEDKGKSVTAADDVVGEPKSIALERERRRRMKDLFRSLQDLMPHVPQKTDKATIVGEAVTYIKALEVKAAMLEKQVLARQAAARGQASSSSFLSTAMPQTAQGMAALCASDAPNGWGGVPMSSATPAVPASQMGYKTWTGTNMVLTVANDHAYITVLMPRRANNLTMVMSVLDNHGIDVVTTEISSSDRFHTLLRIHAHVAGIGGENRRSAEQVYQRAVSEIMYRLNSTTITTRPAGANHQGLGGVSSCATASHRSAHQPVAFGLERSKTRNN